MEQIINPKTDVVFFTGSHDKCLDWLDALLEAVIRYSLKGGIKSNANRSGVWRTLSE